MNNLRNQVQLIGRLGKDPEIRITDNDMKLARVSLATKDIYTNKQGEKVVDTQWHRLIAWGKTAENIEVFLKTGHEIAVHGRLQHRSYTDKEGVKRYITEVLITEFMLLTRTGKPNQALAATA